jgi:hypothetical protein
MPVTLTVDRRQKQDERVKLELRALQENVFDWFADIILSREQALLFAYMVYYSATEPRIREAEYEAMKQKRVRTEGDSEGVSK